MGDRKSIRAGDELWLNEMTERVREGEMFEDGGR